MLAAAVPCAPVRDLQRGDARRDMHARGSLQWIEHPALGASCCRIRRLCSRGPNAGRSSRACRSAPATTPSLATGSAIRKDEARGLTAPKA